MGNLTSQLTRTCNACGIEKPLSAFLQLSGAHGTSYGKICAKCRGTGKVEKPVSIITDDDKSTAPSGSGIRGKEKLYIDTKREQKIHTLKELYRKEDIKKEDIKEDKIERTHLKDAAEKKHREFYIDPKNPSTLPGKKAPASQQVIARQQTQKLISARTATEHNRTTLETKKQQHGETLKVIEKEEKKKATTDFNNLFHAIEPGRIDMGPGSEITRFFTWLGKGAPIVRALNQGKSLPPINPRQKRELVAESSKGTLPPSRRHRG